MSCAVICGTNRKDALSLAVARTYVALLGEAGLNARLIDLAELPHDFAFSALYDNHGKNEDFNKVDQLVIDTDKFVFVVPEYNGSIPGALKTFIDGLSYPQALRNKKAALVGLASGGHGASLALSHLTDILNHCGMNVLAFKARLENIETAIDGDIITSQSYLEMLGLQLQLFKAF